MTKRSYIIARPWGDACGIGHQFNNWLVAWMLAHKYGLHFVHAPFCGNRTQPQIDVPAREWEQFLDLGHNELMEDNLPSNITRVSLPKIMEGPKRVHPNIHCERQEWKTIIDENRDKGVLFECQRDQLVAIDWKHVQLQTLQEKYLAARKLRPTMSSLNSDKINVAIHIRRGDVTENGRYKVRWVGLEVYMNTMNQLARIYGSDNIAFHVFSDTVQQLDLQTIDLMGYNTEFHLWGSDIFETFADMASANILVTGQSAFSCLAAMVSKGVKLVRPWGPLWNNFPDDQRFVTVQNNGDFDRDQLRKESL